VVVESKNPPVVISDEEKPPPSFYFLTENLEASDCKPEQKKHNKRPSTCLSAI
jgi:hypothetical protein